MDDVALLRRCAGVPLPACLAGIAGRLCEQVRRHVLAAVRPAFRRVVICSLILERRCDEMYGMPEVL